MIDMLLNPYYLQIASFIVINAVLGISIYVTMSTGQLSLGNAGFMSVGAYVSAIATMQAGLPLPISILLGALAAGVTGFFVVIPALRLNGVYLAIATLGFGEVIRVCFNNLEITNGAMGIPAIPNLDSLVAGLVNAIGDYVGELGVRPNQLAALLTFLLLFVIVLMLVWFFVRQNHSRVGRAFAAIKADEQAAEAMGINTTYYKILAFFQGALISGLAGALYAHTTSFIIPADFSYHRAVEILIFAVFGGSELIWGPIFGAVFLTLLPEVLRGAENYRLMIYGMILIGMMVFRPQGIIDRYLIKRLKRLWSRGARNEDQFSRSKMVWKGEGK
ncbi:branched-chain amino acid ABC transporter permease [Brevibacillus sp. NRS-1366]|uniref:branched-chain amino acid ABC transporter permease n=1 Tax=Brevibacillus sp. NRS-1366 TaxID=3233899 RepID=UPI003D19D22F